MGMNANIKPACDADAAALCALYNGARQHNGSFPDEEVTLAGFLDAVAGETMLVARVAGKMAGFASVWEQGSFLHHLYVAPAFQRMGIGSDLLAACLQRFGIPMTLKCIQANEAACRFYENRGWLALETGEGAEGRYILYGYAVPEDVSIRRYEPADAEALIAIYRDAALVLGRQVYSEEQTRAWANYPEDLEEFRSLLSRGLTLCAVQDRQPVAFGQLHPGDHIAYLYCHSDHARRGLASSILARLEEQARSLGTVALRVEASGVARPLFERHGYHVVEEERPIRHGVEFVRYRMEKQLA